MGISTDQRWSNIYKQGRDFQLVTSQEVDRFLSYVLPDTPKTCLDIGCGTGQLTRELYHRGYLAMGIDASAEAIKRAGQLTVVPHKQLSYIQVDLASDDLAHKIGSSTPYGVITCKLVYAFIDDKALFLEKVKAVLDPNGIFVVITPLLDDVAVEKKAIAVSDADIALLDDYFERTSLYKDKGLTYFVGRLK